MDMVGFSRLAVAAQQARVQGLTNVVRDVVESLPGEEYVALPTGDGMAVALFDTPDPRRPSLDTVLAVVEKAKTWAWAERVELRVGINTGGVAVVDDINHRRNLCGHAINDAQRVMDAANPNGVLWSRDAVEHHFGKGEDPTPTDGYRFGPPMILVVKHNLKIEARQFMPREPRPGWDERAVESEWKNTYTLSPYPWSSVDHLRARWPVARQVAMVHVNGAVFRRFRWERIYGADRPWAENASAELTLTDEPFGPDLEQLLVFIPTEDSYDLWHRHKPRATREPYTDCEVFWRTYLDNLCTERSARLMAERPTATAPLACELRRYTMLGCILYYFDWSCPGGFIRGAPHLWGVELQHSSNFELSWPGRSQPPAFREHVQGLNYLRGHSEPIHLIDVDARGKITTGSRSGR